MKLRVFLAAIAVLLASLTGLSAQAPKPGDKKPDVKKPDEKKPEEKKPEEKKTDIKPEKLTFNSADGVELQGALYPSKKGGTSPSVILIHTIGKDPNKGGWSDLAITLAEKGFNVLRFDLRGHGNSTNFDKNVFWEAVVNREAYPSLYKKKPLPDKIEMADLLKPKGNYLPWLANDVLAARVALDKLNDSGRTNTGSTYLIGAGDAAGIGMLYMMAEWTRPQVLPQAWNLTMLPPPAYEIPKGADMAGRDISGAIWLSPALPKGIDTALMKKWIKTYPEMREKNPVYCLYGEKDAAGKAMSNAIVNDVLVAKPSSKDLAKLPFTEAEAIATTATVGVDLLGKQLGTEDKIIKKLEQLEADRKNVIPTPNRNYTKAPPILPNYFGVK